MNINKLGLIFALVFLCSCEDKSETNLYRAQQCINTASSETVNDCLNIIGNQSTPRAYVMRCSAAFISQGIEENAIVQAIEEIDSRDGSNPAAPALAALSMEGVEDSQNAVEMCRRSQSRSLLALANFSNLATSMGSLLEFPPNPSPEYIQDLIDGFDGGAKTEEEKAALGQSVIQSQESLCNSSNGLLKGTKTCEDINGAIAENPDNPSAIAEALLDKLKN